MIMLKPIYNQDGTVGAPSYSFDSDSDTGWYRRGSGDIALSLNGIQSVVLSTVQASFSTPIFAPDGSVGNPSISFNNDTDTGIFRSGANDLRVVAGGILVFAAQTTGLNMGLPIFSARILGSDGTVGLPEYSFAADPDTGIYRLGANQMGLSAGGILALYVGTTFVAPNLQMQTINGSSGTPAYSFASDPDTGIYRVGANALALSAGSTDIAYFRTDLANPSISIIDGTAAIPAINFFSDTDTGMYRFGANTIAFACGGAVSVQIDTAALYNLNGTAIAPSYTFTSDTNTGFYRDTADQIGIALGGVTGGQIAQGSFTGTLTGCTTSPTATFNYQRIGNHVHLWCNAGLNATSNATTMSITGAPAIIRPSAQVATGSINDGTDNSVVCMLRAQMLAAGTLSFTRMTVSGSNLIDSAFTAAGGKGIGANFFVSYPIA